MAWNPDDITTRKISARKGVYSVCVVLRPHSILTPSREEASQPEDRKARKTFKQKYTLERDLRKENCVGGE